MKNFTLILGALFMMLNLSVYAQTGGVLIDDGTGTVDGSAMLDVQSTEKGMLVPRMLEAQKNGVATPATGLMIFQTDGTAGFYYYDGAAWKSIGAGVLGINDLTDGRTGGGSVFLGKDAGAADNLGNYYNVYVGQEAGKKNIDGFGNNAIGYKALSDNSHGNRNVAIGFEALGKNTAGNDNIAVGYDALAVAASGERSTAVGSFVLRNNSGNNNSALGYDALFDNHAGSNNTAIGFEALATNNTGNNNTALGSGADVVSSNLSNATAIGYNAKVATSHSLVLGATGTDAVNVGIGTDSPISALHVVGDVYATADLDVDGATNMLGTLDVDGAVSTGALDVLSTLNVDGEINTTDDLNVDGATYIMGTLDVDGIVSTGALDVDGDLVVLNALTVHDVFASGNVGAGSVTINDVLKLTPRTEPPSPEKGDIYFDSGDNLIKYYDGAVWQTLAIL